MPRTRIQGKHEEVRTQQQMLPQVGLCGTKVTNTYFDLTTLVPSTLCFSVKCTIIQIVCGLGDAVAVTKLLQKSRIVLAGPFWTEMTVHIKA